MRAFWYCDIPNFGDILNPYIAKKKFSTELKYNHYYSLLYYYRVLFSNLRRTKKVKLPSRQVIAYPWQPVLFGIGSILDYANGQTIVWGSGFREFDSKFLTGEPVKILAVRGELTKKRLSEIGYNSKSDIAIGDPALLMPLIYSSPAKKTSQNKIGIVPHYSEYDYFVETYGDSYEIINMINENVEEVIDLINSCEYILSTSLHGIIIAHAYNVPALWIKNSNIGTGKFKFHDYFSSVGIPFYDGFTNFNEVLKSQENVITFFNNNKDKSSIKTSLKEIQDNLINTFPN
ncbi:polysaccharide pyruvyl transferase family protein [Formosa sp. 3Alg 14/1]|uniref:polysaccharide pyruvyl transferase family protein n=1 Tax=Formosa sp. 3Alg 14/1 TaxID=3382190 RepID=UPI0039BDD6BE